MLVFVSIIWVFLLNFTLTFETFFHSEILFQDPSYSRKFIKIINKFSLNEPLIQLISKIVPLIPDHPILEKIELVEVALRIAKTDHRDHPSLGHFIFSTILEIRNKGFFIGSKSEVVLGLYDLIDLVLNQKLKIHRQDLKRNKAIGRLRLALAKEFSSVATKYTPRDEYYADVLFHNSNGIVGVLPLYVVPLLFSDSFVFPPEFRGTRRARNADSSIKFSVFHTMVNPSSDPFKRSIYLFILKQHNFIDHLMQDVDEEFLKGLVFHRTGQLFESLRLRIGSIKTLIDRCFEIDHYYTKFRINLTHAMLYYSFYLLYILPHTLEWHNLFEEISLLRQLFDEQLLLFLETLHLQIDNVLTKPFSGFYNFNGIIYASSPNDGDSKVVKAISIYKVPTKSQGIATIMHNYNADGTINLNFYISNSLIIDSNIIYQMFAIFESEVKPFDIATAFNTFIINNTNSKYSSKFIHNIKY